MTSDTLQTLIREELSKLMLEAGLFHDPKTGHFTSGDTKGAIYSLSKRGAKSAGISPDFVMRGPVKSKRSGQPPKLGSTKYGMNTSATKSAGRMKLSGEAIPPKFSVSEYPKRYHELKTEHEELRKLDLRKTIPLGDFISIALEALPGEELTEEQDQLSNACRKKGFITMAEAQKRILMAMNAFNQASKGELGKARS